MVKKFFGVAVMMLISFLLKAQDLTADQQAANFLRESGKLNVVITVLVTIFVGIVIFLLFQERRISKLEKKIKDNEPS